MFTVSETGKDLDRERICLLELGQKFDPGTMAKGVSMAKATKTVKQPLTYKTAHSAYFAATKVLFNQVTAFYFDCIQTHPGILELSSKEALTALEKLSHATKDNPHPVMPLSDVLTADIPAMFRRAAIHAALGSARSFTTHLEKWRKQKEKTTAKGKKFTIRPPVPPRSWNKSVLLYAGQWKERTQKSIMLKLWTGSSWAAGTRQAAAHAALPRGHTRYLARAEVVFGRSPPGGGHENGGRRRPARAVRGPRLRAH